MPKELIDLHVEFISLVKNPANGEKIVFKSGSDNKVVINIPIEKYDNDKKLVYGIVYSPGKLDSDNEYAASETIAKAAHEFMEGLLLKNVDSNHDFMGGKGTVVESYISDKGAWQVVIKVKDDKLWDDVKKGDINGISLAGTAGKIEKSKKDNNSAAREFVWSAAFDKLSKLIDTLGFKNKLNINKTGEKDMNKKELEEILEKDYGIKPQSDAEEKDDVSKNDQVSKKDFDQLTKIVESLAKSRNTNSNPDSGQKSVTYGLLMKDTAAYEKMQDENPGLFQKLREEWLRDNN